MWVIDQGSYKGEFESWDRGTQFGDGLFETILVKNGFPKQLSLHIDRLTKGLERLSINCAGIDIKSLILNTVEEFCVKSQLKDGVYKLIVNRGSSNRGYGYLSTIEPNITSLFNRLPVFDPQIYMDGVALKICKTHCAIQTDLAGLKHLNRLENVLAKQELSEEFEGLMFNYLGFAIEGTMSNVFFEKDGQLYTPLLNLSGVEGTMRSLVIDFAKAHNINVNVSNFSSGELMSFESGFICNSIFGIVPINKLGDSKFVIGPVTTDVQTINQAEVFE